MRLALVFGISLGVACALTALSYYVQSEAITLGGPDLFEGFPFWYLNPYCVTTVCGVRFSAVGLVLDVLVWFFVSAAALTGLQIFLGRVKSSGR